MLESKREAYDPRKIELIQNILLSHAENGTPHFFEIKMDGFTVVPKTNIPDHFERFQQFISESTEKLTIIIYSTTPDSGQTGYYTFSLSPADKSKPLNGTDLNGLIDEKLKQQREQYDKERLLEKLEETQKTLSEAEEYIDNLEDRIKTMEQKPNHWGKLDLGMLAGSALEGILRKNPQWLSKVPGLEGLAGAIKQENSGQQHIPSQPESQVSFSKVDEADEGLSEDEQKLLEFGKKMLENFSHPEIAQLAEILDALSKNKFQINIVADLLKNKSNH